VYGNFTQIVQLFQNIMSNAMKFKREIPLKIEIDAIEQGDFTRISIKDNGKGIAAGYLDKVFQLFFRYHNDNNYVGHGIGLATCLKIIACHGGKIWVESIENQETIFYFTLPAKMKS
jgi:signal transduction histidine kinase